MVTLTSKITIPVDVLFRDLQGESVILNLQTGTYYGLDEVGTRMWHLLAHFGQVDLAYHSLLEEYQVAEEVLQKDILQFVDRLSEYELIRVSEN